MGSFISQCHPKYMTRKPLPSRGIHREKRCWRGDAAVKVRQQVCSDVGLDRWRDTAFRRTFDPAVDGIDRLKTRTSACSFATSKNRQRWGVRHSGVCDTRERGEPIGEILVREGKAREESVRVGRVVENGEIRRVHGSVHAREEVQLAPACVAIVLVRKKGRELMLLSGRYTCWTSHRRSSFQPSSSPRMRVGLIDTAQTNPQTVATYWSSLITSNMPLLALGTAQSGTWSATPRHSSI